MTSFFILEDNNQDRFLIERALKAHFPDCEIRTAVRVSEATKKLKDQPAEILILDLNLPDSIGYNTFKSMHESFPNTPIFIVSVLGDAKLAYRAVSQGAADFLSKEYLDNTQLIAQSVEKSLARSQNLQKIKTNTNKLKKILDASSDGIVLTTTTGQILFYNKMAAILLGTENLLQNQHFFINPNLEEEQTILWRPAGKTRPLTLSISTTQSEWENTQSYCFTIRDYTSRQSILDALISARKKADLSNEAKGTFLANVSHEIRTPLNGIMGAATLLLDTPINREQSDYVRTISQSSDFLLSLINDLLDLSKIEAGKFSVENTSFNLSELIISCLDQFSMEQHNHTVNFVKEISAKLPENVLGDPWRLRQILTNLLGNAFKFTKKGTVRLNVDSKPPSSSQELYWLTFKIFDTGIGISKETLSKLFTPFVQGGSDITQIYGGTGLGLAIAKRLTDLMGGTLSVESELGQGTTFTLELPFKIPDSKTLTNQNLLLGHSETNPVISEKIFLKHHPLVLVAEDHPINQKLVVRMLENIGCRVICANTGKEALERAAHTAVDLILMDCQMPEVDGREAATAIRKLPHYELTPIIAMTAFVYPQDIDRCLKAGMSEVLKKPFKKTELEKTVVKWLGSNDTLPNLSDGPIINRELVDDWKKLAEEDNEEFEQEILTLFFKTSSDFLEKASTAAQYYDYETLMQLLHRFRGSAGHLGAQRLANYLEKSEQWIEKNRSIIPNMLSLVTSEIDSLKNYFKFQPQQD